MGDNRIGPAPSEETGEVSSRADDVCEALSNEHDIDVKTNPEEEQGGIMDTKHSDGDERPPATNGDERPPTSDANISPVAPATRRDSEGERPPFTEVRSEAQTPACRKELAPMCKMCFVNFGTLTSPLCSHAFCPRCFRKQDELLPDEDAPTGHETREFTCILCVKSVKHEVPIDGRDVRLSHFSQILAKGVQHIGTLLEDSELKFLSPKALAVTATGEFVIADSELEQIFILNIDNLESTRRFKFLHSDNYDYKGALAVYKDDTVLVSVKNEKYSSVSFYRNNGKFRFSAFLDQSADISSLAVKSDTEIISVDSHNHQLCVIDEHKNVAKTIKLDDYPEAVEVRNPSSCALNKNGEIIVCDSQTGQVLTFDETFASSPGVFVVGREVSVAGITADLKMCVDVETGGLFVLNKLSGRIGLYSHKGEFISDILHIEPAAEDRGVSSGVIRDILVTSDGRLAVLMSVKGVDRADTQIRLYKYSVPRKYRQKKVEKKQTPNSSDAETKKSCCCALM